MRRFHSSTRVLELDLLYSDPRRFSLSIALLELHVGVQPLSLSLLAMLLICLVNCFTSSLANFPPFRVWHCSWLVFFTCIFLIDTCLSATSVHGSDDSTHESPLPNACTHSTFSIDASLFISLLMSTCILSIDTCLLAICERGLDDSSHVSPLHLPTTCTHSTFSTVACLLIGIFSILIVATCLDAHGALGLDDFVYNSPLPCLHIFYPRICNSSTCFTS